MKNEATPAYWLATAFAEYALVYPQGEVKSLRESTYKRGGSHTQVFA